MPYIENQLRPKYKNILKKLPTIESKGDLEYCCFYLMKLFMSTRPKRYSFYHDCVYAVQHCATEYRRRFLDKRENQALKKNGDIEL